jgi:predicted ATP-grasp superfamily ATP-dependent carboligase
MRILIAGVSVRAAAASAARAGFAVTSLDAYGDADAHRAVRALSVRRDFGRRYSARTAARLSRAFECDAVAYLSNFENDVVAIQALADGRVLLGNAPDVVRRGRDPRVFAAAFRRAGLPAPLLENAPAVPVWQTGLTPVRDQVWQTGMTPVRDQVWQTGLAPVRDQVWPTGSAPIGDGWVCKPIRSGGGQRVRLWHGRRVPKGCYLQEHIDGTPGSVTFVAARGRARVLGISRQLVGERAFGVSRYRFCGNIFAPVDERLRQRTDALAQCAADAFGLVGLNGIDFVERDGVPYPIELNPRWSSSMEAIERQAGATLFESHVEACLQGRLPADPFPGSARAYGKAIVFARETVIVRDPRRWHDAPDVADVPHAGERIKSGAPVCTVFAEAASGDACEAALKAKAAIIYGDLFRWRESAA